MAAPQTLPLNTELAGVLEDMDGLRWIPGVDLILTGIAQAATARLTTDQTQTLLSTICGTAGTDITLALSLLVQHLTNPASNPALDHLDPETAKTVRGLGEQYAYETAEFAPREHTNEAAGLIDGI